MTDYRVKRLYALREILRDDEALFCNMPSDVTWLTGFTGDSSYVFLSSSSAVFITDGRYTEQWAQEGTPDYSLEEITPDRRMSSILGDLLEKHRTKNLLCVKKDISLDLFESLQPVFFRVGTGLSDSALVRDMRMVKNALEIEILRQNLLLTELGFQYILRLIRTGVTERELAAELEYYLRKQGADGMSFETIVASGPRSALPHGLAGSRKVEDGEIVLFDFGIRKDSYCSDFTRCAWNGKQPSGKIAEIRKIVEEAQLAAENAVKPGVRASEVHRAAWNVIDGAGYGEYFRHSTGHGVGIDIHEAPTVSTTGETLLKEGMVFTVEPGIYLPGIGGIRIEDMVVVRREGCEVLTRSSREI
jgi:Xaa-Pro aminopeptidase